jgi:hypothetical protein
VQNFERVAVDDRDDRAGEVVCGAARKPDKKTTGEKNKAEK